MGANGAKACTVGVPVIANVYGLELLSINLLDWHVSNRVVPDTAIVRGVEPGIKLVVYKAEPVTYRKLEI